MQRDLVKVLPGLVLEFRDKGVVDCIVLVDSSLFDNLVLTACKFIHN